MKCEDAAAAETLTLTLTDRRFNVKKVVDSWRNWTEDPPSTSSLQRSVNKCQSELVKKGSLGVGGWGGFNDETWNENPAVRFQFF